MSLALSRMEESFGRPTSPGRVRREDRERAEAMIAIGKYQEAHDLAEEAWKAMHREYKAENQSYMEERATKQLRSRRGEVGAQVGPVLDVPKIKRTALKRRARRRERLQEMQRRPATADSMEMSSLGPTSRPGTPGTGTSGWPTGRR